MYQETKAEFYHQSEAPIRNSGLGYELDVMEKNLDELWGLISDLDQNLQFVSESNRPEASDNAEQPEKDSAAEERVSRLNRRILHVSSMVRGIQGRLRL